MKGKLLSVLQSFPKLREYLSVVSLDLHYLAIAELVELCHCVEEYCDRVARLPIKK